MTIDISKIYIGDTVTLGPFEVTRRDAVSGCVYVQIGGGDYTFGADLIASHTPTPRELEVGDRVKLISASDLGTVRGVDGHEVWVRWDRESIKWAAIWSASDLTLADPNQ